MGVPPVPDPRERHDIATVEDVELLVRRFYQAVIPDPVLGPIFHAMGVDWGVHIPKLVDFWSGRLLGLPGYEGNVAGAHLAVFERRPFGGQETARWLELWHETLDEVFAGPTVERAKARAAGAAEAITRVVRRRHRPPRFVTIGGYEPTVPSTGGAPNLRRC
jgi:hemoglobin